MQGDEYAIQDDGPRRMLMRATRLLNLALLSALVGSAALGFAQEEKKQEEKPARQEEPKKQDEAKPPRQDKQQDRQMEKQEPKRDQEQSRQQAMPQKDKQERPEARGDHARTAGKGGHIPDDKFRSSFGHEHHFNARTIIVQGQPQFQYSGYTFEFVDAWPAEWAYTDDLYVDYVDGEYFLFDLFHPGVRIALFVVM
jgi:hypothetical protein